MKGKQKTWEKQFDEFFDWMEKSGMLNRWERQQKNDGVRSNRRRLNKRIREEKRVLECLN
jgi:hypothetical protein